MPVPNLPVRAILGDTLRFEVRLQAEDGSAISLAGCTASIVPVIPGLNWVIKPPATEGRIEVWMDPSDTALLVAGQEVVGKLRITWSNGDVETVATITILAEAV